MTDCADKRPGARQRANQAADDDLDFDELDEDEEDTGETGAAALICRIANFGIVVQFADTVEDALALAQACGTRHCLGVHDIAYRDDHGQLRTVPIGDSDRDGDFRDRCRRAHRQWALARWGRIRAAEQNRRIEIE